MKSCTTCGHITEPWSEYPCNICGQHYLYWTSRESLWIGDYCPYKCRVCGHYSDIKTPYCAYCGNKDYGRD